MYRAFRSARRKASAIALAAALAGGVGFAAPAAAQDYSDGFVEVYQPVAQLTQGEAPNAASARTQLDAVYAAVQTAKDKYAAGNLTLIVGNQLEDEVLRRRGLEMMIESGQVAPEQLGQFNYYVANFAYNAGDYAAARAAIDAATAAGYADSDADPANDPEYIYLQSYFAEENPTAAVAYLNNLVGSRTVPERWLLRGLQETYDAGLPSEALGISEALLKNYPSQQNWINTLQVINALTEFDAPARVDLVRLMMDTNSLTQRADFVRLAEDLDPRTMGGEVLRVLQAGVTAGQFDTGDAYYTEVRGIAQPRAAADGREKASLLSEGRSGSGRDAISAGDVMLSLEDYAAAEELFTRALNNGGDRDTALTRLGIAQVRQGKFAEAKASFDQVSGTRAPIAKMWSLYAESQAG